MRYASHIHHIQLGQRHRSLIMKSARSGFPEHIVNKPTSSSRCHSPLRTLRKVLQQAMTVHSRSAECYLLRMYIQQVLVIPTNVPTPQAHQPVLISRQPTSDERIVRFFQIPSLFLQRQPQLRRRLRRHRYKSKFSHRYSLAITNPPKTHT